MGRKRDASLDVPGLRAGGVYNATWLGRPGQGVVYQRAGTRVRPDAKRISVTVFEDGQRGVVRALVGANGYPRPFRILREVALPKGAKLADARPVVEALAPLVLQPLTEGGDR